MGSALASCFARSSRTAGETSSTTAGAGSATLQNFFLQHSDAINCVVLADASNGSIMKLWNVGYAVQRCWWGSQQLSLAADRGGRVSWLVESNETCQIGGTGSHKLTVNALAGDMQQDMVFSGSRDAVVKVWSLSTQQAVHSGHLDQNVCTWATWIPSTPCCLQASEDLRLRLWDTRIGLSASACEFVGHNNIITCCDVASRGEDVYFASSSNGFDGAGCEVLIWDRRLTSEPLHRCRGHTETVSGCCFVEEEGRQFLMSVSADCSMRIWNTVNGKCENVTSLPQSKRTMCCSAQSGAKSKASGALLATGCVDGSLYQWRVEYDDNSGTQAVHVHAQTNGIAGKNSIASESSSKAADVAASYSSSAAAAAIEFSK